MISAAWVHNGVFVRSCCATVCLPPPPSRPQKYHSQADQDLTCEQIINGTLDGIPSDDTKFRALNQCVTLHLFKSFSSPHSLQFVLRNTHTHTLSLSSLFSLSLSLMLDSMAWFLRASTRAIHHQLATAMLWSGDEKMLTLLYDVTDAVAGSLFPPIIM